MDTIKGNKLIAEFLCFKPDKEGNYPIEYITVQGLWNTCSLENMEYHESWDWLMPVIEKCLSISKEENDEWEKQYKNIDDTFYQVQIAQTYQAVIEFIKWYNKQTKK